MTNHDHDPHAHVTRHELGELALAGDWACTHRELDALADLARTIAERVREPLHCELIELAQACSGDPHGALLRWPELRERLFAVDAAQA